MVRKPTKQAFSFDQFREYLKARKAIHIGVTLLDEGLEEYSLYRTPDDNGFFLVREQLVDKRKEFSIFAFKPKLI